MTRQSWTAITSAVMFVVLALVLALVHVPYVAWAPGVTVDLLSTNKTGQANVQVSGVKTYPTNGSLLMTTVNETRADSSLSLPEAVAAFLLPHRDVLPRDAVYAPSMSASQVNQQEAEMMDTAQESARIAALRAAGEPMQAMPQVVSVNVGGPSDGQLKPGDLVQKVDGTPVTTTDAVGAAIGRHKVGDRVSFTVLRDSHSTNVAVGTVKSNDGKDRPRVGITLATGYNTAAKASYGIDPAIVGPSAGLMFSLAIYDKLTSTDLVGGRTIAGTGEIGDDGNVSPIGGIREKIAAAEGAHASVFLVPAGNCVDVQGVSTSLRLVKVTTLNDAISSLTALKSTDTAKGVPQC